MANIITEQNQMNPYFAITDVLFPFKHKGSDTPFRLQRKEQHRQKYYSIICKAIGQYFFNNEFINLTQSKTNMPVKIHKIELTFLNKNMPTSILFEEYDFTTNDVNFLHQIYFDSTPKSVANSIQTLIKTNDTDHFFNQQRNTNWFHSKRTEFNNHVKAFNAVGLYIY